MPHHGAFAWADNADFDFYTLGDNEFAVRSRGGVRFVTAINGSGEPTWVCGVGAGAGGSWGCSSDRNLKTNLVLLDGLATLERVAAMPVYQWAAKDDPRRIIHAGPMAQDFMAAFGLGDNDTVIGFGDAQGVAFSAIQGLHRQLSEASRALSNQAEELARLRRELTDMRNALRQ